MEEARRDLVRTINKALTDEERQFLLSFKRLEPEWSLLGLPGVDRLPAVRWKLRNLARMSAEKHAEAYENLQRILDV